MQGYVLQGKSHYPSCPVVGPARVGEPLVFACKAGGISTSPGDPDLTVGEREGAVMRSDDVRLVVTTELDVVTVSVDGNLDYYTAPLLREQIDAVVGGSARVIEVHLGAINLIDSSGLSALVCAYKLARARGKELVLRGEAETVTRLLCRTSLDRVLPLRPPRRSPSETGADAAAASA